MSERVLTETEKEPPVRKEDSQENVVSWKASERNVCKIKRANIGFFKLKITINLRKAVLVGVCQFNVVVKITLSLLK